MLPLLFDVWTGPIVIVFVIVAGIALFSLRKKPRYNPDGVLNRQDRSVAEPIEDHPFAFNPILLVILVVTLFIGMVIMYYWSTFK